MIQLHTNMFSNMVSRHDESKELERGSGEGKVTIEGRRGGGVY